MNVARIKARVREFEQELSATRRHTASGEREERIAVEASQSRVRRCSAWR